MNYFVTVRIRKDFGNIFGMYPTSTVSGTTAIQILPENQLCSVVQIREMEAETWRWMQQEGDVQRR
jgi:hypothetical protein